MSTDVETNESEIATETAEENVVDTATLTRELKALQLFRQENLTDHDQTPCAACNTHVPVTANTCPYCSSNIAANNALVREKVTRLHELERQLDVDHADHARRHGKKGLFKKLFGAPETEAPDPDARQYDTRLLDELAEGDQLTVVRQSGPWVLVRTSAGREGWIFSTITTT